MQKQKNKQKGITLIVLIVTIIILIILAGVSINMIVGQNGIVTQAQKADELTTQTRQKEAIELAVASVQAQGTLEIDKEKLETALQEQLGNTEYELTENGDSFFVNISKTSNVYRIGKLGEVIQEEIVEIKTAKELKEFRDDVNNGNDYKGKYIVLTADINLNSGEQWIPIGKYVNEASTPEDTRNRYFAGVFDGRNYSISGININTTDKVQGLFGLNLGGTIKNLRITECNIVGGIATGGIVGYNYNEAQIISCSVNGNIEGVGSQITGGIAGNNVSNSIIEKCVNSATVTGNILIGGITGYQSNGASVNSCYNEGCVSSKSNTVGGIVGRNNGEQVLIKNCYNKGTIQCEGSNLGGIIGKNDTGTVINSYNIGKIEYGNKESSGYIVGSNSLNGNISKCCYWKDEADLQGDGSTIGSYSNLMELNNKDFSEISVIINDENAFKQDTNNINNGYPILNWQ